MPPRKGTGSTPVAKRQRGRGAGYSDDHVKLKDRVIEQFHADLKSHVSIIDYMEATYTSDAERRSLAARVDAAFPCQEGIVYATGLVEGPVCLRAWQLGWRPDLGQKGLVDRHDSELLLSMMCLQGFKTNTEGEAGAERLLVAAPAHMAKPYTTPKLHDGQLGVGAVAYDKGWTRGSHAMYLCEVLLRLDLLDEVRSHAQHLFQSLCTVYGLVMNFDSDMQRVLQNRGQSLHVVLHDPTLHWLFLHHGTVVC